jgi:chromosome segregation ATPase
VAVLEVMKERLALTAGDLKAARDELVKLRQDVDKNQAYDLERRDRRDTQFKQLDETLKEFQKGLQDCREKLARLEGQYGPTSPPAKKANTPRNPTSKDPETAPMPTKKDG